MPFDLLLMLGAGGLPVVLGGWLLYAYYLHPAWRKQRRVRRACAKAFAEGEYRLVRFHLSSGMPSGADFLLSLFGTEGATRYFTYKIVPSEGAEPDYAGMSRKEIGLVQRYLRHSVEVPHHGTTVVQGSRPDPSVRDRTRAQA